MCKLLQERSVWHTYSMTSPALDRALKALGDRWSLQIVKVLLPGAKRYNDLAAELVGIAPNVLAARLRHLMAAQLVDARAYQERPRRLQYALSPDGRSLADVLGVLETWAEQVDGGSSTHVHGPCGTALHWIRWCPTCEQVDDAGDHAVWL